MFGKFIQFSFAVMLSVAVSHPAFAGFDLGGMIKAGTDLTKAATLTEGEVKQLAAEASKVSDSENKLAPPSSAYAKRIAKLTKGMSYEGSTKPTIKVYLVSEVNAFAMADGTVRVYSGLLDKMTDDEVRYVIGHEIGHVNLGHSKKALQTAYTTSAARKAGAATGGVAGKLSESALGDLAEKLVHAQYSQAHENDADMYALRFMKANKYDPKAAVSALRKLENMFGNESSVFSSHPAPGVRADALEKAM